MITSFSSISAAVSRASVLVESSGPNRDMGHKKCIFHFKDFVSSHTRPVWDALERTAAPEVDPPGTTPTAVSQHLWQFHGSRLGVQSGVLRVQRDCFNRSTARGPARKTIEAHGGAGSRMEPWDLHPLASLNAIGVEFGYSSTHICWTSTTKAINNHKYQDNLSGKTSEPELPRCPIDIRSHGR